MDDRASDDVKHLRTRHGLLTDRITRLSSQLAILEKTLEARQMGIMLTPEEIFEVFGDFPAGEYARRGGGQLGPNHGPPRVRAAHLVIHKDDWKRINRESAAIEQQFLEAFEVGQPADSAAAMAAAELHRKNISRWFYECNYDMHRGLGDMYVADQRFAAHYDLIGSGMAMFVRDAISANAERASVARSEG